MVINGIEVKSGTNAKIWIEGQSLKINTYYYSGSNYSCMYGPDEIGVTYLWVAFK